MPRKIPTVDDSMTVRDMVSDTLKGAGLEVLEAEGGLKALGVLATPRVDLIITDMPNMDGMTLVKRVRASGSHTSMPILTTESGDDRKAGDKGWIVKPFAPEKLLSVVNKACPA